MVLLKKKKYFVKQFFQNIYNKKKMMYLIQNNISQDYFFFLRLQYNMDPKILIKTDSIILLYLIYLNTNIYSVRKRNKYLRARSS